SYLRMMEELTLNYTSPLYGRRTGQIKLQTLSFTNYCEFFPEIQDMNKLIQYYAICGGCPKYISSINPAEEFFNNIKDCFLNPNSYLYEEPRFILANELEQLTNYFAILKAISFGKTSSGEISNFTGIEHKSIFKYLDILAQLNIIKRIVPCFENPDKSRKGYYRFQDNFFRFWFRFLFPNGHLLAMGDIDRVVEIIKRDISSYIGIVFEDICKEFIIHQFISHKMPFEIDGIEKWWHKDTEIDLVAHDKKQSNILAVECKYWEKKVGFPVLNELMCKSQKMNKEKAKFYYCLISRAGFDNSLINYSKENNNIYLYSLSDLHTYAKTRDA
ncbi:DUF234 domain-containing protein, partial [Candidatus Margulisiibacteriota bacterium]